MARELVRSGEVELANITQGNVAKTTRQDAGAIMQWLVPSGGATSAGDLPSAQTISEIVEAVNTFSPQLVHIWGVEGYWGLLTARRLIDYPSLLEMQGLLSAIAPVYQGGLSIREQLACIGPKEILRRSTIYHGQRRYEARGRIEREIIEGHRFITVQSDWMAAQVEAIKGSNRVFRTERALRNAFLGARAWQAPGNGALFCSAAYPSPFKGVHVAIRALALLKRQYPDITLRIAGNLQRPGFRQEGYVSWLLREAERLGVGYNIIWLGPLAADAIVDELQKCSAVVLPTFVESYCVALAEAMFIGAPTVVSYVGGASYLARDDESALFFPPGDAVMCAHQIARLLTDRALAERLSHQSRQIALQRNDSQQILENQLAIYQQVLAASARAETEHVVVA